jgi:hypothetical protein
MRKADQIVTAMLENDHDEHVKAHQLVQKWDGAHRTYKDLAVLKRKSMDLFREFGQGISFERALAYKGLTRADVARWLTGEMVGATHNYKRSTPAKACKNTYCKMAHKPQPVEQADCPACQEPLVDIMQPTSLSDLRGKLAKYYVGVETHDGRKVWFDEPVPPRSHDYGAEDKKAPVHPPNEQEKRVGKWW